MAEMTQAREILHPFLSDLIKVCMSRGIEWGYTEEGSPETAEPFSDEERCAKYWSTVQELIGKLNSSGISNNDIYAELLLRHFDKLSQYEGQGRLLPVPYAIIKGRKHSFHHYDKALDQLTLYRRYASLLEVESEALLPESQRRPVPEDAAIVASATFWIVNLPQKHRELIDELRRFPEFRLCEFADTQSALEQLKERRPDGGVLYAETAGEALDFLREVCAILGESYQRIPSFTVLLEQYTYEGEAEIARRAANPCRCENREVMLRNIINDFLGEFDITDGCHNRIARKGKEEYKAGLMMRLAMMGMEPVPEYRELFLDTAFRAFEMQGESRVKTETLKAAVAERGMSWAEFWKTCYPQLRAYDIPIGQMDLGFVGNTFVVQRKALPCSPALLEFLSGCVKLPSVESGVY